MQSSDLILERGLEAFAAQFSAQLRNAGPPTSEHAVHFCIALGFQAALNLSPGDVVFERSIPRARIDLWIVPLDLVIEVKFRRPNPGGRNLAETQIYGSLLSDFNKVTTVAARQRLVIYVTNPQGIAYLSRSGRGLLPQQLGGETTISSLQVEQLPATAAYHAVADGPWNDLASRLRWHRQIDDWHLMAWEVFGSNG